MPLNKKKTNSGTIQIITEKDIVFHAYPKVLEWTKKRDLGSILFKTMSQSCIRNCVMQLYDIIW